MPACFWDLQIEDFGRITSLTFEVFSPEACVIVEDTIMVMSQGTYTFLACFAGFWLIWALIVMVCCFCSFVQRKLKRRREERLREQCLRALEMEPLDCTGAPYPLREPPQFCPPPQMMSSQLPVTHTIPQGSWTPQPGRLILLYEPYALWVHTLTY